MELETLKRLRLEGKTSKEIGSVLGRSENAVTSKAYELDLPRSLPPRRGERNTSGLCLVCRDLTENGAWACAACEEVYQRMTEIHSDYFRSDADDTPERRARVELYERRARLKLPLFEEREETRR
jgi:hypothetical protein